MVPMVEACDVMKSRKKSRDIVNFVEFASDVPLTVDGTVLDPVPAPITQKVLTLGSCTVVLLPGVTEKPILFVSSSRKLENLIESCTCRRRIWCSCWRICGRRGCLNR